MPYVVKLAHFAAIHLKGSPFTVQNGQSFLIFGDSSSVTSHNYIATLVQISLKKTFQLNTLTKLKNTVKNWLKQLLKLMKN